MRDSTIGRLFVIALVVLLTEDMLTARADPGGESKGGVAPQMIATTEFDPSSVRLPSGSPEQKALEALRANNANAALEIVEQALPEAQEPSMGRLRWIASRASRDTRGAVTHLKALAKSNHPLAPWGKLRLAALLRPSDPKAAADHARLLTHPWAGSGWARSVYALALAESGQGEQAAPLLRELIKSSSNSRPADEEALALAQILEVNLLAGTRREALRLYRQVASRAPSSELGKKARRKIERILAALPARQRSAVTRTSIDELFRRGQTLIHLRRYEEAETVYAKLAKRLRNRPKERCKALFKRAQALDLDKKRAAAAPLYITVADRCTDSEIKTSARYHAGQTLLRAGKPKEAIFQLEKLARRAPKHRLADDALYKAAVAAEDASGPAARTKRLAALIKRYPKGDMRPRARFELALDAFSQGNYPTALDHFDRLIDEGPGEVYEGMRGRAAYWRARTLQQMGRVQEAVNGYRDVARDMPLTYYARQAMTRLAEVDAGKVDALTDELRERGPEVSLTYSYRPEMRTEGFTRAVELLRVGEVKFAKNELSTLGVLGGDEEKSWSWLAAAMLYHAGDYTSAINLTRRFGSIWSVALDGKTRALWRIAFPPAYSPLIEETAAAAAVSPALLRAIAREESGFNARAVSPAKAYGLIQLIVPTARLNARPLGLPSDPESLKNPETNLRIGAEFIRFLSRRYADNPAVVPAAYNAGYVAADRWLHNYGNTAFDEWVERIPYFETRNYTRRVLQSYGVYAWLDLGVFPSLPSVLPIINEQQ
jgi:soluble lytic murein transglycosylase